MNLSVQKELELLERFKNQDSSAFSELYTLYIKKVFVYALSIIKSPVLAEDVSHDVFVKLWEHAKEMDTGRSVQPYLMTMVRNQCLNMIRQASRETWIADEIISNAIARVEDGFQLTQRKDTSRYLGAAIASLPPQRRRIYELCHTQGHTYKQAASKLGLKDSTVNSQMVKALKTIRTFLLRHGALLTLLFHKF